MDGAALAARSRERFAADFLEIGEPGLATLLVGDDPASDIYIRRKHEAARAAGIRARDIRLPQDTPEAEVLARLSELNADDEVDGILVQLPLPDHIDEVGVIEAIDPA